MPPTAPPVPARPRARSAALAPVKHPPADSRRDLRLDFLRGLCLAVMIIDHLGGASWWYTVTSGDTFFVSAGEGFVFISGLVMGLVYRDVLRRGGPAAVWRRSLGRALKLYLSTVALTFLFVGLSLATAGRWTEPGGRWEEGFLAAVDVVDFALGVVTLRTTFDFVDVLVLYIFLVVVAPALLIAFARGLTPFVLAASFGLWLTQQVWPDRLVLPWPIEGSTRFQFGPWQILFVAGLAIGYHRERFATATAHWRRWPVWLALGLCLAGLIALAADQGEVFTSLRPDIDGAELLADWTGKKSLRPGRLIAALIVCPFFFLTVDLFWQPLRQALGWLLIPLGQHALYAYSVHLVLVVLLAAWLPWLPGYDRWVELSNSLAQLAAVIATWWLIHRPILSRVIPK
ncbi:MAG TPA: OpgC domain-containing protein [Dehalococcoidia bacterium]|nr:OpgC domain-containing protein [Dehalococcoidia bacterium]